MRPQAEYEANNRSSASTLNLRSNASKGSVEEWPLGTVFAAGKSADFTPSKYLTADWMSSRVLGGVLFVLCLPLMLVLIAIVRVTTSGPGLYRQIRVGRNGQIFVMLKIRTMVANAEDSTGPVWTQGNSDSRITSVGTILRQTHLDELPQLWNVAWGEMALIGPRPERPDLVRVLTDHIPGYLNRLSVLPGITGLAQLNLPPDATVESVRRKLKLDLEYIQSACFRLDVQVMLSTVFSIVGLKKDRVLQLFGTKRDITIVRTDDPDPIVVAGASPIQVVSSNDVKSAPVDA